MVVELRLRVDRLRSVVLISLQEKVLERCSVFLLKCHHHLVAQSKQHQLRDKVKTQQSGKCGLEAAAPSG